MILQLSIITFILSVVTEFFVIRFCHKHSLYDSLGSRKIHTGNIPRLGGIAIAVSFFLGFILYSISYHNKVNTEYIFLLISGLIIFTVGIIDDLIELSAKKKLLAQLIATIVLIIGGFKLNRIFIIDLDQNIYLKVLSYVVTFIGIVGVINAYNLIDGLDGLCGSITFVTFITYGFIYYRTVPLVSATFFIFAMAILGFLVFNWPPAKVFMGDNGSTFLGFSVVAFALYKEQDVNTSMTVYEFTKILVLLNLTAIPVTDTLAAVWRRTRDHRPIMSPDKSHIHHKLLNIGFSKTGVLYLLLSIQILVCISVYVSTLLTKVQSTVLLSVTYLLVLLFFAWIHYANRRANRRKAVAEQ